MVAAQEVVRGAAGVPELHVDASAPGVDGVGDRTPVFLHLARVDARGLPPADGLFGNVYALGDDEPRGGALGVVLCHEPVGQAEHPGAVAGHRRHDDAVRQRETAEFERGKQVVRH